MASSSEDTGSSSGDTGSSSGDTGSSSEDSGSSSEDTGSSGDGGLSVSRHCSAGGGPSLSPSLISTGRSRPIRASDRGSTADGAAIRLTLLSAEREDECSPSVTVCVYVSGMRRISPLIIAAVFALTLVPCMCQAQDFRGSLAGTVADSSGGRVQSADVSLQAPESSLERHTKTDSRGEFRFDDLLPGNYKLTVRAPGFAEASSNVTVVVSSVREVGVTLNLRSARQTLNVQAQPSSIVTEPVDTSSAVHGGAVTAGDLETIPLANRSFANIAYLV